MESTAFSRRLFWARSLFGLALMCVLVLSLLPVGHPDFSSNDKLNHVMAYTALMLLGALGWSGAWRVALGVLLFGIMIEGLQGMTAYRMFSVADMLANGAGVALGWLVFAGGRRLMRFRRL